MANNKPCWWWVIPCKQSLRSGSLVFADDRKAAIGKVYHDGRYAVATSLTWRGLQELIGCVLPVSFDGSEMAEDSFLLLHNGRQIRIRP